MKVRINYLEAIALSYWKLKDYMMAKKTYETILVLDNEKYEIYPNRN